MGERDNSSDAEKPGPDPSDNDIKLLLLVDRMPGDFATAADIEPNASVGYKQTRNRLDDLVERNLLNRRKVGNVNVYWLSDKGECQIMM